MSELPEIAVLGTTPIAGDAPAGQAIRYEPEFERLQAEVDKIGSVSGVPVNWLEVSRLARSILGLRSKDILVASYLAVALERTVGLGGLSIGLGVFRDLLATFWESLFPPLAKIRGREAAVRWLDEHGSRALADMSVSAQDRETIEGCAALAEAVDQLLAERFPAGGPALDNLRRTLREKQSALPVAREAGAGETAGGAAVGPAPRGAIDSENAARSAILEAVAFLRAQDPTDPRPYQCLRALLWSEVVKTPPHENGVTAIPGGDRSALDAWGDALKGKSHRAVLDEVESRLPDERLWIDLSFLAARALGELGEEFDAARTAVREEVGALLRRLPELLDLSFEGGVPFASEAARTWVLDEVLVLPVGAAGAGKPAEKEGDRLEETLGEARTLVRQGKLPEGTALLQKEIQVLPRGRDRFLWRFEMAKLCRDAKQVGLALPLLESLDEEARRLGIEEWEPSLCVEVVKELWQCYSSFREREGYPEKAAQVYARLCRLDLTAAMALDGRES